MLKKIPFLLLAFLLGALLWSMANANAGADMPASDLRAQHIFKIMDNNADDMLSFPEFFYSIATDKVPDEGILPEKRFSLLDTNQDGIVTREEFIAGWNRTVEKI